MLFEELFDVFDELGGFSFLVESEVRQEESKDFVFGLDDEGVVVAPSERGGLLACHLHDFFPGIEPLSPQYAVGEAFLCEIDVPVDEILSGQDAHD